MGEIKIKWIHIFNLMLGIALAVVFGAVIATVSHFNSDPAYAAKSSSLQVIDDNWGIVNDDGYITEFNDFGKKLDAKEITLSRIFIFDRDSVQDSISFKSYYSAVEVFQDGALIYSYGSIDDVKKGTLLGVNQCVVPLNIYYGEASEIEVHFVSCMDVEVNSFYFGVAEDVVSSRFTESLVTTLFSITLSVVAFIMLVFAFMGRKRLTFAPEYYFFVTSLLVVAIWAITDIQVLGAFGIKSGVICVLSFESFSLMLLPFMVYMYHSCKRMKKADLVAAALLFVNFVAVNVLQFSKVLNFVQSVTSTQILIGVCLVIVMVQTFYSFIKDRDFNSIVMSLSIIIVAIGAGIEIIDFYTANKFKSSQILDLGILLFVVLQVGTLFSGMFELVDEGRKAEDYLSMAKTDPLTGLGNRRGLDLYISEIANSSTPFYRLGCIVCDLNDLKKTNDIYGHDVGDRLIKDFADCLQVCFENRGRVFRTGGDEFYVMFSDVEVDMSAMMRRLSICLDGSNATAEYRISCSRGCYADYVAANNVDAVWDIIKFADAEMYKMKKVDRDKRRVEDPSEK